MGFTALVRAQEHFDVHQVWRPVESPGTSLSQTMTARMTVSHMTPKKRAMPEKWTKSWANQHKNK
jgi:hypothetical protein